MAETHVANWVVFTDPYAAAALEKAAKWRRQDPQREARILDICVERDGEACEFIVTVYLTASKS